MTMNHHGDDLVDMCERVRNAATAYQSGTIEQNLTYACEEFVELTWANARLNESQVRATVEAIASAEGWDPPAVFFGDSSARCAAFVQLDSRSVKFNGRQVHISTVLHELAHRHHLLADAASFLSSREFTPEERSLIGPQVSRYAATNSKEFVAEVLSGYWAGQRYSDEVMALLSDCTDGKVNL